VKGLVVALLLALGASAAIIAGLRTDADRTDPFGRAQISAAAIAAWPAFTGPSSVITENVRAIEQTIAAEYAAAHGRHIGGLAAQVAAIAPDPTLTPGAARTANIGEVCSTSTRELRHWSRERDDRILAEYGLPIGPHPTVEIDHLIPLCLGGTDDDRNLWPEPRRSIEPIWNAERKDELEARMCSLVCAGQPDPAAAQRAIGELS
jgi:hypothetical protein